MATTTDNMNSSDVTVGTDAQAAQYNDLRSDVRQGVKPVRTEDDGTTITFDLENGLNQVVTLGGNRTLSITNDIVGQMFTIKLTQDGTGSRTVTWWGTISWAGGTAPTLTTTASKSDRFLFIVTGTGIYEGHVVGQNI